MEHYFNVNIATKYGVQCAVILNNIYFWVEKNKANEKHFHDGKYWTYNSKKAFAKLMPYLTERQIDYAIQKLIDKGVIETGNYNEMAYDRTLWYAITDFGYSILQNCEMDITASVNGNDKIVQPIPDNKPNKKPNKNTDKKPPFYDIISVYAKEDQELLKLLDEWLKVRKAKRSAMTDTAIQMNVDKLDKLAADSGLSVKEYLKEVICRGWAAFYVINNYSGNNKPAAPNSENGQLAAYLKANEEINKAAAEDASLYDGLL